MSSTTSAHTITVLREMFARYGIPQHLVSDNGPQFVSADFEAFLKGNGVGRRLITHPPMELPNGLYVT